MKKLVFSLIIFATLFTVTGCSEKFDIAASYKDITVIYGFLSRADTAHYIRIQKAFLDQEKNALTMAKEADSSFYNNINVRISRLSIADTNVVVDTIHLTRVDLNTEGYPKQSGTFFNAPNYAYKFKDVLDQRYLYRIVVTNLVTGQVDSSTTPVIDDGTPGVFKIDVIDDAGLNQGGMDFSVPLPNQTFDFNVLYTPPADFRYQGLNSPSFVAYSIIRFNWVDSNIITHSKTPRSYDFVVGYQFLPSGTVASYKVGTLSFYSAIGSGFGPAPENTLRLIDRCDIISYLTTRDYYEYYQATTTQGIGLTGNEIHPIYTNIDGPNALGLYTSRGVHSGKITINFATIKELLTNSLISNVRIVGTLYH